MESEKVDRKHNGHRKCPEGRNTQVFRQVKKYSYNSTPTLDENLANRKKKIKTWVVLLKTLNILYRMLM